MAIMRGMTGTESIQRSWEAEKVLATDFILFEYDNSTLIQTNLRYLSFVHCPLEVLERSHHLCSFNGVVLLFIHVFVLAT